MYVSALIPEDHFPSQDVALAIYAGTDIWDSNECLIHPHVVLWSR
jgi:hypothetical protein